MNRREVLLAGGGGIVAVAGGTAVASATRADVLASRELTRGKGEPATVTRTVTRGAVEYLEASDEVSENGHTQSFGAWAASESVGVGADAVLTVVDGRLETSLEGVGSGVRYLVFGPVVTVDHTVTRDREGKVVNEPNVPLGRLVSVAPRTLTVTVTLAGRTFTKEVPVGVGHGEVSPD